MNSSDITRRFNREWITGALDDNCVVLCEELARDMVGAKISTSFLRNIFGELRRIELSGFEQKRADFVLLRPKLAYACGRAIDRVTNRVVKEQVKGELEALQELYRLSAAQVTTERGFKNLVGIMEAIVAFHKAFGGSEK